MDPHQSLLSMSHGFPDLLIQSNPHQTMFKYNMRNYKQ